MTATVHESEVMNGMDRDIMVEQMKQQLKREMNVHQQIVDDLQRQLTDANAVRILEDLWSYRK